MVRIVERMETMAVKNRKKQCWLGIFLMLALLTSGTVYASNNTRAEEVRTDRISTDQMSEDIAEIIDRGEDRRSTGNLSCQDGETAFWRL